MPLVTAPKIARYNRAVAAKFVSLFFGSGKVV